jgi:glycosyltransferase involved in cell wall biosynthesis
MAKTKILYLISSLAQGGAERHLLDLVRRLDPGRYEADICMLRDRVHFQGDVPAGQPRYLLGSRTWFSPRAFTRLRRAIDDAQPDVLHAYLNDGNLWARLATLAGPRPRIITSVHLDDMPAVYRWLERRLASRSDRIVAHSRSIERLLVGRLGVPAARVQVIANGIEPERFKPLAQNEVRAARAAYGLERKDFVALMPARIAYQKNQDLVVAALAKLKAAQALPERARLLLAGRVSDRKLGRRLTAAVARAGLHAHVRFLGPVRDMQRLYAAADVVLMPSRTEASPIAALEALACGVPVLISAAANTDGVLVDGKHGWQIDEPTVASIEQALREILDAPAEVRRERGAAGRAHVLGRFTCARVADDFMRLYDSLAAPRALEARAV